MKSGWIEVCLLLCAAGIFASGIGCAAAKFSINDFNHMDLGEGPGASLIRLTELQKRGVEKHGTIDPNRRTGSSGPDSEAAPPSPASSAPVRTAPLVSASVRTVPDVPVPSTGTVAPDTPVVPGTPPAISSARMQQPDPSRPAPSGNMANSDPTQPPVSTNVHASAFLPKDNPAATQPFPPTNVTSAGPQSPAGDTSRDSREDYSGGPRYRLGPEDKIRVSVWENKELTLDVVVRPDGKISIPLIQDVQAKGLTAAELADVIRLRLQDFLKNPHVSVTVLEVNASKFYVVGYVKTPGTYPLRGDVSVLQALSLAGGFTDFASPKRIRLIRKSGNRQEVHVINYYDVIDKGGEGNILLRPGDTIVVP